MNPDNTRTSAEPNLNTGAPAQPDLKTSAPAQPDLNAGAPAQPEALLRAENLTKTFLTQKKKTLHAVSSVNLSVYPGETLALVGESGCGKSTLAKALIRMVPATSGTVFYRGKNITGMTERDFRPLRMKMQMVFQDPYASLDPRMTVRNLIAEPLDTYHVCGRDKQAVTDKVLELMDRVGLPGEFLYRYPHQFSGGQRQRIGIARAIALDPELLICDEPVSALDVSVQSQILNLLKQLREDMHLTSLFIGHDLSVIYYIADRVCVMFLGTVCEIAPKKELFSHPLHPYTEYLLDAIPKPDPHLRGSHRKLLEGDVPSPVDPPPGCRFHTRCPYADERCRTEMPALRDFGDGHFAACHRDP